MLSISDIINKAKPLVDKFNEKRTFRTFCELVWNLVPVIEEVVEGFNETLESDEIKGKSKEDIAVMVLDAITPNFPFKALVIRMVVKQAVAFFNKNGWKV